MKTKKTLFTVIVIALVIAFGVSAFFVGNYIVDGKQSAERNDELANIVANAQTASTEEAQETTEATEGTEETTEATEATEPQMLAGYKELYEMNQDTVGWVKIENTKLDYAVMQSPDDKDYYLYRNFDKNQSTRGSVYAWWKSDVDAPSDNITIFGHNMADGSMFHCLLSYENKATWENNPLIFFDTLYEYHTYKIFAVFKTTAAEGYGFPYHRFADAANEEEFNAFVKQCKDLAFYDTGITPKYGDKLICLSTCEYTDPYGNGRFVVAAVQIT